MCPQRVTLLLFVSVLTTPHTSPVSLSLLYDRVCMCVYRPYPVSLRARGHRGPAALHPPAPTLLPQEVAAAHEDDVTHQPERGHAPPPPRHRHQNTGEAQK